MNDPDYDIAISGYGPTGLAAASLLARRGHRVCVFERWPALYGQPRVATIDGESARIIQAACDVDFAFRNSSPRERYLFANGAGEVLVDFDWSGQHVSGHPNRISLHQPDIEDAMDAAARAAGAEINMGWELSGIAQDAGGVDITARERKQEGGSRTIRARYLIGADGARSATREILGIEREVWPFRGAWLSADGRRLRELPDFLGCSPDGRIAAIFCAPEGRAHSIIPLGNDVIRINFQVDPDADRQIIATRQYAHARMKEVYGLDESDVDVFRLAVHAFEGRLAKTWRAGRVFLAGDAAHAMTPFMGQGGCSAFRDAINLSWKLDLVLRGIAPDSLLDSYEIERKPHARFYVDGSDKLGALAFTADPEAAARRDAQLRAAPARPALADLPLENGILHMDANGRPIAPAGLLGPQGRVAWNGREGRFDDLFGWGFQILCRDADPRALLRADQIARLERMGCALAGISDTPAPGLAHDIEGRYAIFFGDSRVCGLIVRPDFTVYAGVLDLSDLPARVDELFAALDGV